MATSTSMPNPSQNIDSYRNHVSFDTLIQPGELYIRCTWNSDGRARLALGYLTGIWKKILPRASASFKSNELVSE